MSDSIGQTSIVFLQEHFSELRVSLNERLGGSRIDVCGMQLVRIEEVFLQEHCGKRDVQEAIGGIWLILVCV